MQALNALNGIHSANWKLLEEVCTGLERQPRELPCKLFYDEKGSQLFDRICESPEYYPTRTEHSILIDNIEGIAQVLGPGCLLVEYGSGSSQKTKVLLDNLDALRGYVPIDISGEYLEKTASKLRGHYPDLPILPLAADYTREFQLPELDFPTGKKVVYFPGSTIGNFHPSQVPGFLKLMAELAGETGCILIGVDLRKDPRILNRAYNDAAGWTAAFNLNILAVLNDKLGADFDPNTFAHKAFYNACEGRVEMHLESLVAQYVEVGDKRFALKSGERIWTESSYKYTLDGFAHLGRKAGLQVSNVWTDSDELFSIQLLEKGPAEE